MRFGLWRDGEFVNDIIADEEYVAWYAEEHGYRYTLMDDPAPTVAPEPGPTAEDIINVLLGVNEDE